jgi:hypothetical protein
VKHALKSKFAFTFVLKAMFKKAELTSALKNQSDYADNLALPLALRLASTFLPFAVAILFLKPCSLALCLFLG